MNARNGGEGPGQAEALLRVKLVIFAVGAAFGIAGMAADSRILLTSGTAVLFAGVLLRFLPRFRRGLDRHPDAPEDEVSIQDGSSSSSDPPSSASP